jgi:hypothetical protein
MGSSRKRSLGAIAALALGGSAWVLSSTGLVGQTIPKAGLSIDALAQTVWVEEFDVSPDGNLIAYNRQRPEHTTYGRPQPQAASRTA